MTKQDNFPINTGTSSFVHYLTVRYIELIVESGILGVYHVPGGKSRVQANSPFVCQFIIPFIPLKSRGWIFAAAASFVAAAVAIVVAAVVPASS